MASRKRPQAQAEPGPTNDEGQEPETEGEETEPEAPAPLARKGVRYVTKGGKRRPATLQESEDGEKL